MTLPPSRLPASWWKQEWLWKLVLVVGTLLVYQPAWHGDPVFDDDDHLTPPELRSLGGLARIWTEVGAVSQYYPLAHSVFWLEHRLWGDAMPGYHLVNILLHAAAALLVLRVLTQLAVPGAWLAAAIFAWHPVHAESVAWISEQKNTLSAVFYLGAACAYLYFDQTRRRGFHFLALLLFVAGLLSKTVVASLPAALLVLFWWKRGTVSWRKDVLPLLPFFAASLIMGLVTIWVERKFIGAEGEAFQLSIIERFLVAGRAVWFYVGKLLWPADLIFIYPRWQVSQAVWWQYLFPVGTLLVVLGLWAWRRRSRAPLAALLFFAGTLFPALGFVNVYPFVYSFVADHYQYLASLGIITAASSGAALLLGRWQLWGRPAGNLCCAAILAVLAGLTWRQSHIYQGVEVLWRTTLSRNPECFAAHSNLGNHLLESGQVDEAIAHCRKAVQLQPRFAEIHNNLANALHQKGLPEEAIAEYRNALAIRPDLAVAASNLGALLLQMGRTEEALHHLESAVKLRPGFNEARGNLANALLEKGRTDEAIAQVRAGLEIAPDFAPGHNTLGSALVGKGRLDEALTHFQKAVEIAPGFAKAHYNLASVFLQQGRFDEAIAPLENAIRAQPDFPEAHFHLGGLLAELGRAGEALAHFREAVKSEPGFAEAYFQIAGVLFGQGQPEEAIANYRKALEIAPEFARASHDLGWVLLERGQVDEAIARFEAALKVEPGIALVHNNLAVALLRKGRAREALAHYQTSLELRPDDPRALADAAWLRATWTDASVRDGSEAIRLAQRANQVSGGQDPMMLRTLAAAYAEAGQFDEAVASARQALRLAESRSKATLAFALQSQIKQYEAGLPFRDPAAVVAESP